MSEPHDGDRAAWRRRCEEAWAAIERAGAGPYLMAGAPPAVSVLPTERLAEIVQRYHVMAEALIEIGTSFDYYASEDGTWCICQHCGEDMATGCPVGCYGQVARRALGVG
ncbi:MAG TPA: hypothetical protein VJ140_07855 [Actinomycetota bacterium]|nr:hypothetical protein [Actinomycetota bacterium]